MQVSGLGISPTVTSTYTKEGVGAFYKGLPFAWGREIFYTSIKLGGKFFLELFCRKILRENINYQI